MSQTLELPDDVYAGLQRAAEREGLPIVDLLARWAEGPSSADRPASPGEEHPNMVTEVVNGHEYAYQPVGDHIVASPRVCGGRPVFKHTRIDVRYVWHALQGGRTIEQLVTDYSGLVSREAIEEAIRLGRERGSEFFEEAYQGRKPAA